MFTCPICEAVVAARSTRDIASHLFDHKNRGDTHNYPIQCKDCAVSTDFKNSKTFAQHYSTFHGELIDINSQVDSFDNNELRNAIPNVEVIENEIVSNDADMQDLNEESESLYMFKLTRFLLNLASKSSLPFKILAEIIQSFSDFIKVIENAIVRNFDRNNMSVDCLELYEKIKHEFQLARNSLTTVNTDYKIKKLFNSHPKYVAPIPVEFGLRNDVRLYGGQSKNIVVKNLGYVVPIGSTLKTLLSNPEFFAIVEKNTFSIQDEDQCYSKFSDGESFKNHELFSDKSKLVIQIQLNNDDMGTTNPLRGHSAIHKVGTFFFTIQNLPASYNTASVNVHLAAQYHTVDVKRYGYEAVLGPIMDDINMLETNGILVDIPGVGIKRIFATISQFSADSLALNQVFGLIESFSGDYCCAICYATKLQMSTLFFESDFVLRTKRSFELDLEELSEGDAHHVKGVKSESLLNRSVYFNIANNQSYDIMHVLLEGTLPYEVGALLYDFIERRNLLTWHQLNDRIRCLFSGLEVDKSNTPCELNAMSNQGSGISPKLSAVEMWALFRYLPLILGDLLPSHDTHWVFLQQLQMITDFAFATTLTETMLIHFTHLYADHMKLFTKLFPNLVVKPKQHFLVHFRTMVRANGPLALTSCLKYELRNNFSKRLAHIVCNFKNIAYTLTSRNQYTALYHHINGHHLRNYFVVSHKKLFHSLDTFPCADMISKALGIPAESAVEKSLKVKYYGRKYSTGNIVVLSKISHELKFGKIDCIIWKDSTAYLLVQEMNTIGFYTHFHAYEIESARTSAYVLVNIDDLLDFHPLDLVFKIESNAYFVRLRHHIP